MKKSKGKNKNKIIERQLKNNSTPELKTAIKIVIGVLLFIIVLYFVGRIASGELKLKKDKDTEATIQYSEILAEKTFKQKDNEYYVMYYYFDDNSVSLIEAIASHLSQTAKVYKVDLKKNFNSDYISDSVNKKPKNLSELKVTNPTLIKIESGNVTNLITGLDSIKDYSLNN